MIIFYSGNLGDHCLPELINLPLMLTWWEIDCKDGTKKRPEARAKRRFHNIRRERKKANHAR